MAGRAAFAVLVVLVLLAASGQFASAQSSSHAAPPLTADQREAQKRFRVADTAIKDGNLDIALDELQKAVELDGKNSYIWYDLAVVQSKKGMDQDALDSLNKAEKLGLPEKLKASAAQMEAQLTYNVVKTREETKGDKILSAEQQDKNRTLPSMQETLDYLNKIVDSDFISRNKYVPGKFSVDTKMRTLWFSGMLERSGRYYYPFFVGASFKDLDGAVVEDAEVHITCSTTCWRRWNERWENPTDRSRLLRENTKPSDAAFDPPLLESLFIYTTGDPETSKRFRSALQHLIDLGKALPDSSDDDPFAK